MYVQCTRERAHTKDTGHAQGRIVLLSYLSTSLHESSPPSPLPTDRRRGAPSLLPVARSCAFVPQKCRGLQGSLHLRPPIFHGGHHLRSLPTRLSSPFSPDWKSPHWRCLLHACSACSYFAVEPFGGGELVMVHYEGAPVVRRPCASASSLGMIFARLAS